MAGIDVNPKTLPSTATVTSMIRGGGLSQVIQLLYIAIEVADMAPSRMQLTTNEASINGLTTQTLTRLGKNSKGDIRILTLGGNEVLERQSAEQ